MSEANIIGNRKTGIIEFCLMLISSDAEKRLPLKSDVNIIRCQKKKKKKSSAVIEFCLMSISSDAEKQISLNFVYC